MAQSLAYYQDQLKSYWFEIIRPKVYEYEVEHGVSCTCCLRIPKISNYDVKPKLSKKTKRRYIE